MESCPALVRGTGRGAWRHFASFISLDLGPEEVQLWSGLSEHRVVIAASTAVSFLVLCLVGLAYYETPSSLNFARDWNQQRWIRLDCGVEDVGIAYRGNCMMDVSVRMTQYSNYKECMGRDESVRDAVIVRHRWDTSAAGLCATKGDRDYWFDTGHEVRLNESGEELEVEAERRLRRLGMAAPVLMNLPHRMDCHNSYLLWAQMRLPAVVQMGLLSGEQRCAYEFGSSAPSITGNWQQITHMLEHLRAARDKARNVSCWVLADDNCVVAFHDEKVLILQRAAENASIERSGIVCGALSLVFFALALFWHAEDSGWCGDSQHCHWSHQALPTEEPELSARVRHVLGVAGSRFGEATPDASGEQTVRCDRNGSVEVFALDGTKKALPRNVAADFCSAF